MRAQIGIDQVGRGRIVLDGHDVSDATRGMVLRAAVGRPTELELDLVVIDDMRLDGEFRVVVPESTREALVALGWTPPAE
ncbi:MAG TPA: hypothetical protein VIQ30_25630 [Pseudonocardia sp.]